ncbi:CheR family methyltransferase [Thermodesulfobacteriota bacterium]
MESKAENSPYLPGNLAPMSDQVFQRFSSFVYKTVGIKMPPVKKTMLQARLSKRVRRLGFADFEEYSRFVFDAGEGNNEMSAMIDIITTNKTDFFREANHFNYLVESALPALGFSSNLRPTRDLRVWSAGCSSGQEPYTLAIVLNEYLSRVPGFGYSITASDICTEVLKKAVLGIYDEDAIDMLPVTLRKKYFLKGRNGQRNLVRIIPKLRQTIRFKRLNFMDDAYGFLEKMDIIFCRNVLIYFDAETQNNVLNRLCDHLHSGGYLFLGHSETLNGFSLPVKQVAPTIYRKL